MKTGRWRTTDGVAVWLVAAILCVLAGDAPVQESGAADREPLVALADRLPTASPRSSSSNTGTTSDLFVPVILTASGASNSYYTSELTLTNRGSRTATLHYTYRAAAGGGNGTASETLAPGRQKIVPNAIDHLRALGIPIPSAGTRIGTLRVEGVGVSEVSVTVRTTTRVANGRAGLAYPGVAVADGFSEAVYLCGLRQNRQDRSNVAFQNMGVSGNITVRATVFSGDSGDSRVFPDIMLAPGGFRQFNRILATAGFTQGYVKVERVEGTAPFYAYGVINDQANSDGSFVFPVTASSLEGIQRLTLPVVIENPNFSSELIVTNFSDETKAIDFSFVAEAIVSEDRMARFFLTLAAGEQRILPEIVEELRRRGVDGVGRAGRTLAGAVFATERRGNLSGVVIGARTGSPGGGGQYSVFYNAVPYGAAFDQEAWIDALQQNEENRSNLAMVNTGEVDGGPSVFQLDLYNGATGLLANTVTGIRIPARGWRQINGILGKYAPGTTQGYVRIRKIAGNNPFLAYGVINDGGAPGQRSGDGAYLSASGARQRIDDPGTGPATDRAVLKALYEATDGPNWVNNENWLTDAPLGEWYGVTTDMSGRVASLILLGRWDQEKDQLVPHGLWGSIPPQLGDLSNLSELDLSFNRLSGPIPAELGNLANLRSLKLFINNLTGPIPPELGDLANLRVLDLGHNFGLSSPIPPEFGKLANLEHLHLGRLDLSGTIPPELGNLTKLRSLGLAHCGGPLGGPIPPELGNLTNLTWLSLQYINLTGPIPPEIGNLTNLRWLHLEGNDFTGPIPPELGNLTSLSDLALGQNQLTGPIPPELGNLTGLTELWLPANDLSGPVPTSMLQLEQLDYLSLSGTQQSLSGNERLCVPGTPAFAAWLQGIDRHDVGSENLCNASDIVALHALYDATGGDGWTRSDGWLDDDDLGEWHGVAVDSTGRVKSVDLASNGLSGELPRSLSGLGRMNVLRIGDNALSGRLPLSLTKIPLREFNYADTDLCVPTEGSFQTWLNDIPSHQGTGSECAPLSERDMLRTFYDSMNGRKWARGPNWLTSAPLEEWYGVELDASGNVSGLALPENGLAGPIPIELGYLESLERLDLGGNNLSGPIPPELGNLTKLWHLSLRRNDLSGPIPPELGDLESLERLDLDGNNLSGPIPPELGDLESLGGLHLDWNNLSGPIPPELGDLESLEGLDLDWNNLSGPIPPELGNLTKLWHLSLRRNDLSGPIPPELGDLESLEWLDLGGNNLSGPIPLELGNLTKLWHLSLRRNDLSGPIPPKLGNLTKLLSLSLDRNDLSGPIPPELGDLESLEGLDLRANNLSGPIPPELGNLTKLLSLYLSGNDLSGRVPSEFSGMAMLREFHVANNSGMQGALPSELIALARLETLIAGGTGLCVPADPGFQAWLEGIDKMWIARCTRSTAYLTQAVQSREFPVPLVAREKALLRVFPTSQESTDAGIPPIKARFYRDGRETHVVEIPGQSTPIPTEVQEGDLAKSATAEIPGELVQPGLEMVIEIDPEGTLDSALGVAKRIPEEGRLEVEVQAMPLFDLTLIPFVWTETNDSSIVDLVKAMEADPYDHEMFAYMHTLLPVGEVAVTAHESVLSSSNSAFALLNQTTAIWALEGGTGHYKGMMSNPVSGLVSGVALQPGRSSFSVPSARTIAHELGHNMSLGHAPCGTSGDPSYPYPDGSVGAWGYDFRDGGRLMHPSNADLMAYCEPNWISGYHFTNALRFRLLDEGAPEASAAALPTRSILLWGGVSSDTVPFLEPAFVVDAPPMLPDSAGEWRITGRAENGRGLFDLSFTMPEVADGDGRSSFAFTLPAQPGWADQLASITLSGPSGSATLDHDTNRPVTILRNPRSGQIRAILRDRSPATLGRDNAASALGRDNAASALAREEPGLEVLTSRGIPDPEDWTR